MKKPNTLPDCSAVVTGLLLGMNLPVSAPLWMPAIGSVFAIVVVKQLFGGIGKNFLNPALAARVFLMMAWAGDMSNYEHVFDAVAGATPLVSINEGIIPEGVTLLDLFLGRVGGCIGEVSVVCLLVGGVYLLVRRVIRWHIPVAMLGTVAILTFLFPIMPEGVAATLNDRLVYMSASLCGGGLVLGAIFMATDYVTSPVTDWGRIIYGVACGALVVFFRYFSGYNEGVSFAILIMNTLGWYLYMATKPRVFGKSRRAKKSS
jgi:electron transport complex protein RnfD